MALTDTGAERTSIRRMDGETIKVGGVDIHCEKAILREALRLLFEGVTIDAQVRLNPSAAAQYIKHEQDVVDFLGRVTATPDNGGH